MFKRYKQAQEFRRLFPGSEYYVLRGQQKQLFHAWVDAGCPGEDVLGKPRPVSPNTDVSTLYFRDVERLKKAMA